MFEDRKEAGRQIGEALEQYRNENPLILGIPRGGVMIAAEAARHLGVRFTLIIARKLPFPRNPEAGFGAIAEDGSTFVLEEAAVSVSKEEIEEIKANQKKEITRRVEKLRGGKPLPDLKGKTVILTDDGIAMGSTMRASVSMCRNKEAGKVVIAVPVCSPRVQDTMKSLADDVVVLESPPGFRAVAEVYRHWYDVSDREVLDILSNYSAEYAGK